jgi:4,5-DOPA dioxygenase extradiol
MTAIDPTTSTPTAPARTPARTPAVFIGHGSPMNTLEHNRYTQAWHDFGTSIPKPKAILAISAHWYTRGTAVTAMARPKTIHDFGGFPDELFAVQYPAIGNPELAAAVAEIVKPTSVVQDNQWGLDHGTWSVLNHMYPNADVPVVQLSIDGTLKADEHVQLGAALAPLREQGVLIVGSGNVVHNLSRIQWGNAEGAFDWAEEFDEHARTIMIERPQDIASVSSHRQYRLAAPTPEHLLPVNYIAGLAAAANEPAEILVAGYAMGSVSMTSYIVH